MKPLKDQSMSTRSIIVVLAVLFLTNKSTAQEIRVVNHSGLPICITLLSNSAPAEVWIDNKTITDIPIRVDANVRVVVIRHALIVNEKRLADPVRVLTTNTIKPDDAKSGCIFLYLHLDNEKNIVSDLLCLGKGEFMPFNDTQESLDSFKRSMRTLHNDLRFSENVNVNNPTGERH